MSIFDDLIKIDNDGNFVYNKLDKMKENDIVTLINLRQDYKNKNLYLNTNGIILKVLPYEKLQVLFLNDKIVGDYAVVVVNKIDVKKQDISLPLDFINELKNSNKLSKENINKKHNFENLEFKECDKVELITEDEKYLKFGLHKGAIGYIAIDYAISNSILVDFSEIDKHGEFNDNCISVNIKDLKVIK